MHTTGTQPLTSASLVSFADLFGRTISDILINEVEIPLIQRDYAQGRNTESVKRIRDNFLNTLVGALQPGKPPVDLDFIFGDVETSGRFYPLDGQQRLTTLFLLHCYLAWRIGVPGKEQPWARFSYATRPGARTFCAFLVAARPDFSIALSAWIRDQAAYLPTWEYDPTIQSMLTVLDSLHQKMVEMGIADFQLAYDRLLDRHDPAIRFHLLPMKANKLTDTLYIKMNSRGKPLTRFENFKAHFEALLKAAGHRQAEDFSKNVDTHWSDILWEYRGSDNLIDDEFLRYFRCISEINAWNAGIDFNASVRDEDLAEMVYGVGAPLADASVSFLFQAFDVWKGKNVRSEFEGILARPGTGGSQVPIYNAFDEEGVDLFAACCRHYGSRQWTRAHSLVFYGVLVHYVDAPADPAFPKKLRILRNLTEASGDEIRAGERNNMPKLLAEVRALIIHEDLQQLATFNQVQVANEKAKAAMLDAAPALQADLHALEDHDLLRGGLAAMSFDAEQFSTRARTFLQLFDKSASAGQHPWKTLTGALLAQGDYARSELRGSGHRAADFGAPRNDEPWRHLFRGRKQEKIHPLLVPLTAVLDAIARGETPEGIIAKYLNADTTAKDWRYYFVKYDDMRVGASGRYTISARGGYQACMLDKERLTSYYYDPYLYAMVRESGIGTDRIENARWPCCFTGYETDPRKLVLTNSRVQIRCVDEGLEIGAPDDPGHAHAFEMLCESLELKNNGSCRLLAIPKSSEGVDTEDRIRAGAILLQKLLASGL